MSKSPNLLTPPQLTILEKIPISTLDELYKFKRNGCALVLRLETPSIVELDTFDCLKHERGEGSFLLLHALRWVALNRPKVTKMVLSSVPVVLNRLHTDTLPIISLKKAAAQRSLNSYYNKLGFSENLKVPDEFAGDIYHLIKSITGLQKQASKKHKPLETA